MNCFSANEIGPERLTFYVLNHIENTLFKLLKFVHHKPNYLDKSFQYYHKMAEKVARQHAKAERELIAEMNR